MPFYVLVYGADACIGYVDEVDLTSSWCSLHQFVNLLQFTRAVIDIEAGVWPAREKYTGSKRLNPHFGAHGDEETPVLIPNTEVKLISGDYTAKVGN